MSAAILGLVCVILGAILTRSGDWVVHFFKQRSNGRYAAVRIITLLDGYAQKCASVVSDDGTCEGRPAGRTEEGLEYYAIQVKTPEAPAFPDDIDWLSIDFNLMYRILSLPNTARETDRDISAEAEYSSDPENNEVIVARQEGYAHLGLEVVNLIKELRKEFGLPAKFRRGGRDLEKFFQDELSEFQKNRESNATARARMSDEFAKWRGEANDAAGIVESEKP